MAQLVTTDHYLTLGTLVRHMHLHLVGGNLAILSLLEVGLLQVESAYLVLAGRVQFFDVGLW